eukprot:9479615-Pyramimonas_sp.AAC.1
MRSMNCAGETSWLMYTPAPRQDLRPCLLEGRGTDGKVVSVDGKGGRCGRQRGSMWTVKGVDVDGKKGVSMDGKGDRHGRQRGSAWTVKEVGVTGMGYRRKRKCKFSRNPTGCR